MGDPSWNWGDNGGQQYGGFSGYDQSWQQPSTKSHQQQNNRPAANMDYYSQRASNFGSPQPDQGMGSQGSSYNYYGQHQQDSYGFSDMFPQQLMADPMLNAAKQIGGQFAEQQKEKLTKYLSAFQLKYYFAVDNSYVGKKLGILFFPFAHRDWAVCCDNSESPIPPRLDVNAPDLYIPIMAFMTYVLISGFVLGTQGRFEPEQLGIITTNALAYLIFENIVILITKYVMNVSQALSFWHTVAYSSYKFVGMNLSLLAFLLGGKTVYYCTLVYTSISMVFFLLRTVKNFVIDVQCMYSQDGGRKRKLYLLLFISFTQPFIMWWLTSGVTNFTPGKMDFAQLALSGIGLGGAASKKQLPLLPDGEVDYEALLKMP